MERTSKIVLDPEKLNMLDAIYLSHAHTDHIDPYTLIEIYKYANPILILPITLQYLEEIFHQYIPNAQIEFLSPKRSFYLK